MRPALHAVRELLLSPRQFFESHDPAATLPYAVAAVLGFALAFTGVLLFVTDQIVTSISVDVLVLDNPDHPVQSLCQSYGPEAYPECAEPDFYRRTPTAVAQESLVELGWHAARTFIILWVLGTMGFAFFARLVGGSPSVRGTVAVTAWCVVPAFVYLGVAVAVVHSALPVAVLSLTDEHNLIVYAFADHKLPFLLATIVIVLWQWRIARHGVAADADLDSGGGAVVAMIPLLLAFIAAVGLPGLSVLSPY
ncbi:YIP1 family protein [Halovenus halobia]|uniref:YIP1 family protein n=1 Tax=Halovenus halobia TaxID=3396622 RepID=UPI003F567ABB